MINFDLSQVIKKENIFFDVDASDAQDLIGKVARKLAEHEDISNTDRLIDDAITREAELPTSLDNGIAMPHARCSAVDKLICAFVRPRNPLDFKSPDGNLTDIIFFSAIPANCVDEYLHLTARLVRKLNSSSTVEKLRASQTPEEVLDILGVLS